MEQCCENCVFSTDYGESVLYIKCEKKRKYVEKKQPGCKDYAGKQERIDVARLNKIAEKHGLSGGKVMDYLPRK